MDIGIIGAGLIGGTLARLLSERGNVVRVATRDPHDPRLAALPEEIVRTTPALAARFGIATIISVPFAAWPDIARAIGPLLAGRVVLDTSNALPARDGSSADAALRSGAGSGAAVAALLPQARIVKAFNTIRFAVLAAEAGRSPAVGIPLAGDDAAAVAIAASIVAAAGFAPVPAGPLRAAATFDAGTALFDRALPERDLRAVLFPSS